MNKHINAKLRLIYFGNAFTKGIRWLFKDDQKYKDFTEDEQTFLSNGLSNSLLYRYIKAEYYEKNVLLFYTLPRFFTVKYPG